MERQAEYEKTGYTEVGRGKAEYEKMQKKAGRRNRIRKVLTYAGLSIWALIVLFPFYWMLLTSVKSYGAYNAEHIPAFFTLSPTLQNYIDAFTQVPLVGYLLNTVIFAVLTTALMVVVMEKLSTEMNNMENPKIRK